MVKKLKNKKKPSNGSLLLSEKIKQIFFDCLTWRYCLRFFSIFFATLLFLIMVADIVKPELIRPKQVSDFSTKNKYETKLDYFHRIGKSEKQIQISNFTDIATDMMKFIPVAIAITMKNPVVYVSFANAYITETLIGSLLRVIVKAPRPDDVNNKTSFPSGHSIYIFSVATMSLMVLKNKCFGILIFCFAIFIAYCRIFVNRHFPIDVICGAFIGSFVTIFCYFIVQRLNTVLAVFNIKKNTNN